MHVQLQQSEVLVVGRHCGQLLREYADLVFHNKFPRPHPGEWTREPPLVWCRLVSDSRTQTGRRHHDRCRVHTEWLNATVYMGNGWLGCAVMRLMFVLRVCLGLLRVEPEGTGGAKRGIR